VGCNLRIWALSRHDARARWTPARSRRPFVQAVTTDNVILLGLISKDPEAFELVDKPFTVEP